MTVDRDSVPTMSDLKRMTQSNQGEQRTPPAPRTAAATAGRMRASEERAAARLAERGWVCFPPDYPLIGQARALRDEIDAALTAARTK